MFDNKKLTEKLEDELPRPLLDDLDTRRGSWYTSDELIEHIVQIVKNYLIDEKVLK